MRTTPNAWEQRVRQYEAEDMSDAQSTADVDEQKGRLMMSAEQHAPTPWTVTTHRSGVRMIDSAEIRPGVVSGICQIGIAGASNAAFIVKAVNSHEAMLEALEGIARGACIDQRIGDKCICYSCTARAAIAKAKGEA